MDVTRCVQVYQIAFAVRSYVNMKAYDYGIRPLSRYISRQVSSSLIDSTGCLVRSRYELRITLLFVSDYKDRTSVRISPSLTCMTNQLGLAI